MVFQQENIVMGWLLERCHHGLRNCNCTCDTKSKVRGCRLGEKALPLYELLKKIDKFVWDDAADAALQGLKDILSSPPILAAPQESESMLLYLEASNKRYPHFQKLSYRVFLGSRKLRHYFQEHPMTVVSKAPLSTIIKTSDATGRLAKWGIELSAFDIN
ncbi:uncharacterized protein [Lolium perenne]|uniref:uncharacterized protein n=1 Tax=Lolium perenne TaxID=4522 RepID=UPI003A9A1CC2